MTDVKPGALRDDEMMEGVLSVTEASTVICLRARPRAAADTAAAQTLARADVAGAARATQDMLFGARDELVFGSGWEILMGQREVVNWMRCTADQVVAMRYGGEFNFAGGGVDAGESLDDAVSSHFRACRDQHRSLQLRCLLQADRELREEFALADSDSVRLRAFSVKQTRPVKDRSTSCITLSRSRTRIPGSRRTTWTPRTLRCKPGATRTLSSSIAVSSGA
jgi:8-oxo-dGTP pyrophosphatase MutT (NUDIX family)